MRRPTSPQRPAIAGTWALVILVAAALPAHGQDREPIVFGRAGIAVPVGDLGGFTETGPSVRVGVRFFRGDHLALVGEAGVESLSGDRMDVRVVPVQAGVSLRIPTPRDHLSANIRGLAGVTFHQKGPEKPCPPEDSYCLSPPAVLLDDAASVSGRLTAHYRVLPTVSATLEAGVHHVPTAGPDGFVLAVFPHYEGTTTLPVHLGVEFRL